MGLLLGILKGSGRGKYPVPLSSSFINHLRLYNLFDRVMLVSGDRESKVVYLAEQVGIKHVYFSQSPEQKLELVRKLLMSWPC